MPFGKKYVKPEEFKYLGAYTARKILPAIEKYLDDLTSAKFANNKEIGKAWIKLVSDQLVRPLRSLYKKFPEEPKRDLYGLGGPIYAEMRYSDRKQWKKFEKGEHTQILTHMLGTIMSVLWDLYAALTSIFSFDELIETDFAKICIQNPRLVLKTASDSLDVKGLYQFTIHYKFSWEDEPNYPVTVELFNELKPMLPELQKVLAGFPPTEELEQIIKKL